MDRRKDGRADGHGGPGGRTVVLAPLAADGRMERWCSLRSLWTDGRTDGRIRMDGPGRIGGWTYGEWTDGWADGQKEGRLDGWAEGGVDGRNGGACSACCGRTDGRLGGWTEDGRTVGRPDGRTGGRMGGTPGGRTDGTVVLAPLAAGGRSDGRIPWPPKITYINTTPSPSHLLKKSIKFTELVSPKSFSY